MRYLVLSQPSQEYAAALSSALYDLSAHPTSQTQFAVPWYVDAVTGDVLLDLTGDQYLQPDADVAAFVALLPVSEQERADVLAVMENARGSRLAYLDMLPPSLTANLVASYNQPPPP